MAHSTKILSLSNGLLQSRISPQGAVILDAYYDGVPILRPYSGDPQGELDPGQGANFPLVPFGNRVEDNSFVFDEREYHLSPNTDHDAHYLHGDGWLSTWELLDHGSDSVHLALEHRGREGAPYSYYAQQRISLGEDWLDIDLDVSNRGESPMPFGLGQHLFFPMTPKTVLQAGAKGYWTEKPGFLADKRVPILKDLDFSTPRGLPKRWINNGFDGWDGQAELIWPERNIGVRIHARKPYDVFFLFQSDTRFEKDFNYEYFCFEPMTHLGNAHKLPDLGGLVVLSPGESLKTTVRIQAFRVSTAAVEPG